KSQVVRSMMGLSMTEYRTSQMQDLERYRLSQVVQTYKGIANSHVLQISQTT
ncbi:hypothetical protein L9F63_021855, partial [Diploptera punctata]